MNPVQRFFRRYIFSTVGILALFLVVNLLLVLTVLTAGYMSGTDNGLSVRSVSSHVTEQGGVWKFTTRNSAKMPMVEKM